MVRCTVYVHFVLFRLLTGQQHLFDLPRPTENLKRVAETPPMKNGSGFVWKSRDVTPQLVLSLMHNGSITNYAIQCRGTEKLFSVMNGPSFPKLNLLQNHHKKYKENLPCTLKTNTIATLPSSKTVTVSSRHLPASVYL